MQKATVPVAKHYTLNSLTSRDWRLDALWQLFVAASGYIVYSLSVGAVQWLGATKARASLAIADGHHVIDLEKLLHIFREQDLQSLIIGSNFWMQVFNAIYMW